MRCKHEIDLHLDTDDNLRGCTSCHPTVAARRRLGDFAKAAQYEMGTQGYVVPVDPLSGSMTPMRPPTIESVPPVSPAEWEMPSVPLKGLSKVILPSYGRPTFANEYWHGTHFEDVDPYGHTVVVNASQYWDDPEVIDPGESVVK